MEAVQSPQFCASSPWEAWLAGGRICFHTAHLLTLYSGLCVRVCACGRFHVALIYLQTSDKFYVFFFLLELPKI